MSNTPEMEQPATKTLERLIRLCISFGALNLYLTWGSSPSTATLTIWNWLLAGYFILITLARQNKIATFTTNVVFGAAALEMFKSADSLEDVSALSFATTVLTILFVCYAVELAESWKESAAKDA